VEWTYTNTLSRNEKEVKRIERAKALLNRAYSDNPLKEIEKSELDTLWIELDFDNGRKIMFLPIS
jgi:hypothetical protein